MNSYTKQNVLITGAAGGLGKAFAVECASRGWDLFLSDLDPAALETLAAGLRGTYDVDVTTYACDLTEPAARSALFDHLHAEGRRFTLLLNVAGIDHEGPFVQQSARQIRSILRLNIEATLEVTHEMLKFRDPLATFRIVTVASMAAFHPMPVKATYAASKRFLLDFFLALREELRPMGATVTVLCPAGMPTNPESVQAIAAQGLAGQLTTLDTGRVAYQTINAALAGRAVVLPGWFNRLLEVLASLLPSGLLVRMIGNRWQAARQKRRLDQQTASA